MLAVSRDPFHGILMRHLFSSRIHAGSTWKTRRPLDILTDVSCNNHQQDGGALHVLAMSTRNPHRTAETLNA
eukprot:987631-Pyramimonas_sp.AAC.1